MAVESEVPKFQAVLQVAPQEGIKFRMNLSKLIAVLDRERVGLESIHPDRKYLVLVQNDAAMLLPPWDLKASRISEINQLAVLLQVNHEIVLFKLDTLFRGAMETDWKTFSWNRIECLDDRHPIDELYYMMKSSQVGNGNEPLHRLIQNEVRFNWTRRLTCFGHILYLVRAGRS